MPPGRPKSNEIKGYKGNSALKPINQQVQWTQEQFDEYTKCAMDIKYFINNYVRIENVDEGVVNFKLRDYQHRMVDSIVDKRFTIMLCPRQVGKALSLDTPILSKEGFKTVGNVSVGDIIYGRDGKETKVTFITEIMNDRPCFEVVFDNGEKIIADAEHQWNFKTNNWKSRKGYLKEKTLTTQEIYNYIQNTKEVSVFTDITKEIEFDEKELPIDPYLLGVWLGDGNSAGGRVTCHKDDFFEYEKYFTFKSIRQYNETCVVFRPENLEKSLRLNNLLNNKHIPKDYIFSSIEQRLDLLKGLMDTDGSVNHKGICEFYQKNKSIIEDVRFILSSLGIKSKIKEKEIKDQIYYTLIFTSKKYEVFKLTRKLEKQKNSKNHPKSTRLYIKSIKPIESVPVRCLTVDNEDHMFLCGKALIPTHNSTVTAGVALHFAIFKSSQKIAILANKDDLAKELLTKVTLAYENLPSWMQHGIKKLDAHEIVLENNSRILARATSKSAIRGKSITCLILDEFAHVENNIADDFYASTYSTISSGKTTKLIIISTPNKYNLFYKLWTDAENKRNTFNPVRVFWEEVDGRDDEWKTEQIANTSKEQFAQEHECSFDSSSNGLIDADKIKEMMRSYSEPIQKDDDDKLYIYEKPLENQKYLICVDTAKGVEKDYSAFVVIKISKTPYEVVAVYRNNKISPLVFPDIIYKVGINYNEADLLIENNEYGNQITTTLLYEYEYPNIIWTELTNKKQRIAYGNDGKALPGVRTTQSIKNIGCSNLKAMIEHNKLIVKDYQTISELSTFIRVKDSFEADEGSHDDLVMCLVLAAWLATQNYFKDIEQNVGEEVRNIYEDNINLNMLGFGFFTSGKPTDNQVLEDDDFLDYKLGWRPKGYENDEHFEISIYL